MSATFCCTGITNKIRFFLSKNDYIYMSSRMYTSIDVQNRFYSSYNNPQISGRHTCKMCYINFHNNNLIKNISKGLCYSHLHDNTLQCYSSYVRHSGRRLKNFTLQISKLLPLHVKNIHTSAVENEKRPNYNYMYKQKIAQTTDKIKAAKDQMTSKKEKIEIRMKEIKEDIMTVPNLLTVLRMASAPLLGYLVLNDWFKMALCLFVAAGITDVLDGYIARNFKNQMSALGTFLDPLADKLLVSVLMISLTMADLIPIPLTVLILARDIGLIGSAFYIRYLSLPQPKTLMRYFDLTLVTAKLHPNMISKMNTAVQLSLVAVTLAAPVFNFIEHPFLQALRYLTALTTISSGVSYIIDRKKAVTYMKDGRKS